MKHHKPNTSIVRIYLAEQGYFQGLVTGMTTSGITVDFVDDKFPEVPEGARIELALSSDRLRSSLRLPAVPVDYMDNESRRRYRFEIEGEIQMALTALVEGRNDCRVTPNVENRVIVMMRQLEMGAFIQGSLDDVSRSGLSVLVDEKFIDVLARDELTTISFIIPGERTPIQLDGYYRHHAPADDLVRLGFELKPCSEGGDKNEHARFRWYVESLKDELLSHLRACCAVHGDAA